MKERPIPMNGAMVRAVLDGRKTQTRRVVKAAIPSDIKRCDVYRNRQGNQVFGWVSKDLSDGCLELANMKCPYGQPGDRLWVRESMRAESLHDGRVMVRYMADEHLSRFISWPDRLKEKPVVGKCLSNGGPREFSRLTLEITGVRVERLNDISEEDAKAEGIAPNCCLTDHTSCNHENEWIHYGRGADDFPAFSARESFQSLWESINGEGSWEANPWVWVIEFKVVLP